MIKINSEAWETMVAHAQSTFPDECCGVMIGTIDGERQTGNHRDRPGKRV